MRYIFDNFKISVSDIPVETIDIDHRLHEYVATTLKIPVSAINNIQIINKSVDARGSVPSLIYTIALESNHKLSSPKLRPEIKKTEKYCPPVQQISNKAGIVIVGTGPAGLMAAYILSHAGLCPLILDCGSDVDKRSADIAAFHNSRKLNVDSNYLLGEGGAGTFSDGKLYTRVRDCRASFIVDVFISAGAPAEIAYLKRPHIGSDILPLMVKNIRQKIENAGGFFRFNTTVSDIINDGEKCCGVITRAGEVIEADNVIIAQGLGGRALTLKLLEHGLKHDLKGFQIGCRIEHRQKMIDQNQYKLTLRPRCLSAAEYNFVSRPGNSIAGVSTFCMCPGGEIVPSTAFLGQLSTNGMSRYKRDGEFANSCLIVTIPAGTFTTPGASLDFLTGIEKNTFAAGGNDYSAPAQDALAFIRGEKRLSNKSGSYCFGMTPARLDRILPSSASHAISVALRHFDRLMPGFIQGTLVGTETFISSPVRFERNLKSCASSLPGLYIVGEGAGFAGGIMSAAIDGVIIAENLLNQYLRGGSE